jgi:hypothetical protein
MVWRSVSAVLALGVRRRPLPVGRKVSDERLAAPPSRLSRRDLRATTRDCSRPVIGATPKRASCPDVRNPFITGLEIRAVQPGGGWLFTVVSGAFVAGILALGLSIWSLVQ